MSDGDEGDYGKLLDQIAELTTKLQRRAGSEVADDALHLLRLVDQFHRLGLTKLVGMIEAWRGEIFLEAVQREPVAGTLLRTYDLPKAR